MIVLESLLNGLLFGATYSLVAIGFTLIFGVIHRLNIAHGAIIMVSAYAGATVALLLDGAQSYGVLALAFVVSVATGVLMGLLTEAIAFRPLRDAWYLAPFVTTIGLTIALEEVFLHLARKVPIFLPEYTPFPSPLENLGFQIGEFYVRGVYLVNALVALALMFALNLWITRSRSGRAMRVVEENADVARLMGIDVRRVEMTAFAVASGLAGAAGCLIGTTTGVVFPFMGANLLLISFVVIVIAGIGNVRGAMVAGVLVGAIENLSVTLISATYKQAVLFAVLFLVLVFKPEGLFTRSGVRRD
jgi:branched-chain amino acid transport system permease protein